MKELFYAERGKGTTRNGHPILSSPEKSAANMSMVVDWGNKDDKRKADIDYFSRFFIPQMFVRRVVPQFASALGPCHIAEGIDALVSNDTWVEDHSGGALILSKAGGYRSNFYDTGSFNHRRPGIIAAHSKFTHTSIVEFLGEGK